MHRWDAEAAAGRRAGADRRRARRRRRRRVLRALQRHRRRRRRGPSAAPCTCTPPTATASGSSSEPIARRPARGHPRARQGRRRRPRDGVGPAAPALAPGRPRRRRPLRGVRRRRRRPPPRRPHRPRAEVRTVVQPRAGTSTVRRHSPLVGGPARRARPTRPARRAPSRARASPSSCTSPMRASPAVACSAGSPTTASATAGEQRRHDEVGPAERRQVERPPVGHVDERAGPPVPRRRAPPSSSGVSDVGQRLVRRRVGGERRSATSPAACAGHGLAGEQARRAPERPRRREAAVEGGDRHVGLHEHAVGPVARRARTAGSAAPSRSPMPTGPRDSVDSSASTSPCSPPARNTSLNGHEPEGAGHGVDEQEPAPTGSPGPTR